MRNRALPSLRWLLPPLTALAGCAGGAPDTVVDPASVAQDPAPSQAAAADPAHDEMAVLLCEAWLESYIAGRDVPMAYSDTVSYTERMLTQSYAESYVTLGESFDPVSGHFEFTPEVATRDAVAETIHCRGRLVASGTDPALGTPWSVEHEVVLDLAGLGPPEATSLSVLPVAVNDSYGTRLAREPLGCMASKTVAGGTASVCQFDVSVADSDGTDLARQIGFFDGEGRLLDALTFTPYDAGIYGEPAEFDIGNLRLVDVGLPMPVLVFTVSATGRVTDPYCGEQHRVASTYVYAMIDDYIEQLVSVQTLEELRFSGNPADCGAGYTVVRSVEFVPRPGVPSEIHVTVLRSDDSYTVPGTRDVYAADESGRFGHVETFEPPTPP